jgi:hemerythrin
MNMYSKLITWSPSYSIGIKIIDDQHKGLFKLVNEMYNHIAGNEEAERTYFKNIIQRTIEHIRINFATEEKILLVTKFPSFLEHKSAHESFILTLIGNMKDIENGKKINFPAFTHFLRDWILTHIAIMDRQDFDTLRKSIRNRY